MEQSNKRKYMFIVVPLVLFITLIGLTYAFFNYTRTGLANTISVGQVNFSTTQSSGQNEYINLINVFPVDVSNGIPSNNSNVGELTINVTGDTSYSSGIEYLITAENVQNTIGTGNDAIELPIDINVTATSGLGTVDDSYFTNRENSPQTSIYKVLASSVMEEDEGLVVGYIKPGQDGINGNVLIKAYLDISKIGISDTYYKNAPSPLASPNGDYATTEEWAAGRTILTTTQWESLQSNGISFQIKVEANEGIWVEEQLTGSQKLQRAIAAKEADTNVQCSNITYVEDGITYLSGTNDCVDMNYVWYSGKLWRITAIYPDGSMKLVTENNITSIAFNALGQVNFYTDANTTSYMYQWLNEDFYDTLYHASDFIDITKQWNATMPSGTNVSTKPGNTNLVTANVGLLNNYDYYNSYRCIGQSDETCPGTSYSSGYLNNGYYWWLLNPYNASNVWFVSNGGSSSFGASNIMRGSRPSIYLKSGLEFTGNGTSVSPYKIVDDRVVGEENELINTRLSGEYVKLDNGTVNQKFRIIAVEDNKTKIIAMDYAENKNTRKFATSNSDTLWGSGTSTDADTWYTFLNATTTGYLATLKTTYGDLFDSGLYYLGTSGYNYKLSVCANTTSGNTKVCNKTNDKGTFNIGLPRHGEMFATQQAGGSGNSIDMWLMNRYSASYVRNVSSGGNGSTSYSTNTNGVRPTVHLKSTVKIISGTGTENDPYVVGL